MARVFVGNLPTAVQERDLESEFDKFGRIRSISVKFPQRPPPFAFIEYEDERDASDAVRSMHGREFHGSRLRVEISHGGGAVRGGESGLDSRLRGTQFRVKVSNLPTNVSWQDLKDFLRDGGDVAHADVDRRGNGVASFATFEDMDRAIRKLDDTELSGERIRIREDRDDSGDAGSRSGGGGGGGGGRRRSRSRSRSRSWSRSRSRSRSPPYRSRRGRSYSRSPSPPRRSSRRRSSRSRSR